MEIPGIILEREYFFIYSKATGLPYLGEGMEITCFERRSDAMKYEEGHKDTETGDDPIRIKRTGITDLYLSGADSLCVKPAERDEIHLKLLPEDHKGCVSNRVTVRNLILLKQTGCKKYLRNIKDCDFYMPVFLKKRKPKKMQDIGQCHAERESKEAKLIFASIKDFEEWGATQKVKWDAVRIPFKRAAAQNEDINIYGHLLINDKMLKVIFQNKEEENGKGV